MMFAQMSSVLPHIKSGKLRALGVTSLKRSSVMPDVPTIAEQGLARFEAVSWYALMVPAGTPRAVIDRLNAETTRLLARPELKRKLAARGMDVGGKPQELAATIQAETVRWAEVIRQKNISPNESARVRFDLICAKKRLSQSDFSSCTGYFRRLL